MRRIQMLSLRSQRLFTLGLLLVLASPLARAAVTGSISGTVTDPTGAVMPGVSVVALDTDTGIQTTTQTNAAGFYNFPALPTGHYEIRITETGFEEYRQTGLVIDVNTALRIDATMKVGSVNQEVSVTSTAVHVETTNTQMGEVIGNTKMTTLPLNGRSYTDLLALQPGVVPSSSGESSAMGVSGNLNPGAVAVSGQRESANGFILNGGNAEERLYNATAIIPNLDSIAEFRILTNNADAEYGSYTGGLINVVTKQGTNQFHGDAFEFVRNPQPRFPQLLLSEPRLAAPEHVRRHGRRAHPARQAVLLHRLPGNASGGGRGHSAHTGAVRPRQDRGPLVG